MMERHFQWDLKLDCEDLIMIILAIEANLLQPSHVVTKLIISYHDLSFDDGIFRYKGEKGSLAL